VLLHSDYVPNASLTRLLGCDRQKGVGPFVCLEGPKSTTIVRQLGSTIHLSLFDAALPRNLRKCTYLINNIVIYFGLIFKPTERSMIIEIAGTGDAKLLHELNLTARQPHHVIHLI